MCGMERCAPLLPPGQHPRDTQTPPTSRKKDLGFSAVLALIFFNVSGGPLGSEQIVSYGGPVLGLSSLLAFALVYSLPQALITAELSTAFPRNGGYSIWVREAFGDFWAVQESYWAWFSGVIDCALYPALLYAAAAKTPMFSWLPSATNAGEGVGSWEEYLAKVFVLLIFSAPNLFSSRAVGKGLVVLGILVMAPYCVMTALAIPHLNPSNLHEKPTELRLGDMLSIIFWSMSGFDSASTFAGEVDRPQRTFPRVLLLSVLIQLLCYIFPLLFAAMIDKDWTKWDEGSLTDVANKELGGGKWLATWTLISAVLSNWGLFASELFEDSYMLLGMGETGLAPSCFGWQKFTCGMWCGKRRCTWTLRTPIPAILFQIVLVGMLLGLDYNRIVCIDNFFTAASSALEFASALRLRTSQPDLHRPFRVPLGTILFTLFVVIPPFAISLIVLVVTAAESTATLTITSVGALLGLALWPLSRSRLGDFFGSHGALPFWVKSRLRETEELAPEDGAVE